ncbi:MAG: ParA family protein, partial [Chloroflexota bacterium]|nr:ParA family protein [Chloroflexota bacterium]
IANQKGGVGKTTSAVTLAHGLALKHYSVLVVDLDPQGQCASHLGMAQESGVFNLLVMHNPRPPLRDVVRATGRESLYLLPGNKRTASAQTLLTIEGYDKTALAHTLGEPRFNSGRLHYVVLDTAPSAGGLQEMALYAADIIILPAAVDYLSLEGVAQILGTLEALERPQPPLVRVLPTFYDEVTRESAANLNGLRERFGRIVLEPIHRAVALRECPPLGKTVFEHKPDSRAATEYASVVWEVIDVSRER